jgi:hypothetical protein
MLTFSPTGIHGEDRQVLERRQRCDYPEPGAARL